ncbi:MAG: dienelactone hydrolase family protein [Rhodospirillales bacterium]|nr:dienelactone hydrolase family protein [Rhodospirillales bacterium]
MKRFFSAMVMLGLASFCMAEVQTKEITYKHGDVELRGFLTWDDEQASSDTNVPGVLIVHQWMGLTDYEKKRARQLAKLGYVAFALDIYGVDNRPTDRQEAAQMSGRFKGNRKLFRERLNLGLEQLKKQSMVDTDKLAAIGYCFGGTGVLELARSGADIAGVVSFHGGLDSPSPEDGKNIKCSILICHGADDPYVPEEGIEAMTKEFDDADVDWVMIYYSDAVHSFTQEHAGNDPSRGAAYNAKADKRSWRHMRAFFKEVFKAEDEE